MVMTRMRNRAVVCAAIFLGSFLPHAASAQSPDNVALVINDASPDSKRIGEHYARTRGIPAANVIHLATTAADSIARPTYVAQIETPIASALRRHSLQDRVLYIVLTKGMPLRIEGTAGQEGTVSSVDSELTLLYRRMTGREVPVRGRVANPYFLGGRAITEALPFTHRTHDIYLVTRLTAFTVDEAIAMIDRARSPLAEGRFVLDQRAGVFASPLGDRQLADAYQRLSELGVGERVILESTTNPARDVQQVLGYYSWGSNDAENRVRRTEMRFVPGAIAAMFVSGDARTFDEPPAEWRPTGDVKNRSAWFQGSPQSLAGDLIREGVTGVAAHVAEPYLQSAIRPDVLFPTYVRGFNLAEAFYLAMPDLSWQSVVVGDPLCAPFPRPVITPADLNPGTDPETELPVWFSSRRAEFLTSQLKTVPSVALGLYIRGETRLGKGDDRGAREALESATREAPAFAMAQLQLALLYEQSADHAKARERYQAVLQAQPNNAIALNNLAYSLAVHMKNPAEALPFARRAVALAPNSANIVDTLAWVHHLQGNAQEAARLLRGVVQRNTGLADVHLHAAIVFAAAGDLREAGRQLQLAIQLQPALDQSAEVRELRARLKQ